MEFYEALRLMLDEDKKITHYNWTENGYIYNDKKYFCLIYNSNDKTFPWLPNHLDLRTDRWELFFGEKL